MALTGKQKWQRWKARHAGELAIKRLMQPSVRQAGKGARYTVVEWGDFLAPCRRDSVDAVLGRLWDVRGDLPGGLGDWLRGCAERPPAKLALSAIPLTRSEAIAVATALAGFPPICRGGRNVRRPVTVITADAVRRYPSVLAAGVGEGVISRRCYERLATVSPDATGRIWLAF